MAVSEGSISNVLNGNHLEGLNLTPPNPVVGEVAGQEAATSNFLDRNETETFALSDDVVTVTP